MAIRLSVEELKVYARHLEPYLEEAFASEQSIESEDTLIHARQMLRYLREFCLQGGKRLRPYLVASGYQLLTGRQPDETIVRVSVLPELVHAFLLIHDDIMDESEMRRGYLTVHRRYEREGAIEGGGRSDRWRHFGESMGILAGDLMYTLVWQTLNRLALEDRMKIQLMSVLNQAVMQAIAGQEMDIRLESQPKPTVSEVLTMHQLKTANYSFVMPLKIGAFLAEADNEAVAALVEYATHCGVAFQIQDDILGLFGEEEKTGKSAFSDLKQDKRTILIAKAFELADPEQVIVLEETLGALTVSRKMVDNLRQVVRETGALHYCENTARDHVLKAKGALQKLVGKNYDRVVQERLADLADFTVQRDG
jgi:geranylgeranyl pyrophosphate synthase